eukprot:1682631-Amphidinium_carterae.1
MFPRRKDTQSNNLVPFAGIVIFCCLKPAEARLATLSSDNLLPSEFRRSPSEFRRSRGAPLTKLTIL